MTWPWTYGIISDYEAANKNQFRVNRVERKAYSHCCLYVFVIRCASLFPSSFYHLPKNGFCQLSSTFFFYLSFSLKHMTLSSSGHHMREGQCYIRFLVHSLFNYQHIHIWNVYRIGELVVVGALNASDRLNIAHELRVSDTFCILPPVFIYLMKKNR